MSILLLHPGDMGSAVGACLRSAGHQVFWVSDGRSPATRQRAERAGLEETPSLLEAIGQATLVLSVCPPHGAVALASEVIGSGFTGTYVDANAVSPATSRQIQAIVEGGGVSYVDGGIIGQPPAQPETTRLYLCGDRTESVAARFEGTNLEVRPVDGPIGSASALKMAYAAWTKGSAALLNAVFAVARVEGVANELHGEWRRSQPALPKRLEHAARSAPKAWRWVAEMEEIADTFADAGMPEGFHRAAAEIFGRLVGFKDADSITVEEVMERLSDGTPESGGASPMEK